MIKNHPFQNGNKRIAVTTLFYFLFRNGCWLDVTHEALYEFSIEVAGSKPEEREKVFAKIRSFIRVHLKRINTE